MGLPDHDASVLLSLLAGGFAAAFLHAALPTHWLPFVLVGRAQNWTLARTLGAAALAGLAHIATTAVLGLAIVLAGLALSAWIADFVPFASAALLILLGTFYLVRATFRRPVLAGVVGSGAGGGGSDLRLAEVAPTPSVSDAAALWGLIAVMAVTPGEVLLPIYLSSASDGALVLVLLTVAFAAGTILGMVLLTGLARAGASILKLERWARYEGAILGIALIGLGLLVLAHRH